MSANSKIEWLCLTCHRTFVATAEEVAAAEGHLCIAADRGLTQAEALAQLLQHDRQQ